MRNLTPRSLFRISFGILLACSLTVSLVADSDWDNSSGGDFGQSGNWDPDVPGTTDSATFNLDETYTVTFDDDYTNTAATVSDGTVTFDLNGNTYTTTASTNAFTVQGGSGQDASLLLTGGGTLETGTGTGITARIGMIANGSGAVTVDDATWDNTGSFQIGTANATGSLTIQNGGTVTSTGNPFQLNASNGSSVVVNGGNSSLSVVDGRLNALGANSTILVENGGSFSTSGGVNDILDAGAEMTVTGVGSHLTIAGNTQFYVRGEGSTLNIVDGATADLITLRPLNGGHINISGGATVSGAELMVAADTSISISGLGTSFSGSTIRLYGSASGSDESVVTVSNQASLTAGNLIAGNANDNSGSKFIVTGLGTEATVTSDFLLGSNAGASASATISDGASLTANGLVVGNNSSGFFEVNDATVNTQSFRIGRNASGNGTALITNGGTVVADPMMNHEVSVGTSGIGALTISAGGSLSHNRMAFIGRHAGSSGSVTIDGASSSWNVGSTDPLVSGTNALSVGVEGTGTLILANGGTVTAGNIIIGENGTLAGDGFAAALVTNSGLVSPGNSTGILYTLGGFTQTSTGVLEIGLGGLTAGTEHDQLSNSFFNSDATLAGTLNILSVNGFMPSLDDAFLILDFSGGSINGSFDTINAFSLDSGLAWNFDDLYIDGTISVIPEPVTVAFLLGAAALGAVLWRRRRAV